MTNAIPDDVESDESSANVSIGSNENVHSPIGIFTKYPNDENEMFEQPEIHEFPTEVRKRRKIMEIHSANDGSFKLTETDEQNIEEPAKVPLQGIITAIETDLVTTALLASVQLHKRQSMEHENITSAKNDSFDTNENLFEDLFNFTRPEIQTDAKENVVKIPLNGLVSAVESTLIHSAQNLKDTDQFQSNIDAKHAIDSGSKSSGLLRIDRDTRDGIVQVQTLDGNKAVQSLNILSSIALNVGDNDTALNATAAMNDGDDSDNVDTVFTTEYPEIQGANFTVIHASDTVSLVSDDENKLAHVQHQAISKTVFQSNLAIFPTIAPKSLATSLSTITSAEQTSDSESEETNPTTATNKTQQNAQRNEFLREKIAEVQAPPVILSSFP